MPGLCRVQPWELFQEKMTKARLSRAAQDAFKLNYEQLVAGVTGLVSCPRLARSTHLRQKLALICRAATETADQAVQLCLFVLLMRAAVTCDRAGCRGTSQGAWDAQAELLWLFGSAHLNTFIRVGCFPQLPS